MLSNYVLKVFSLLSLNDDVSKLFFWLDTVSLVDDLNINVYLQIDVDRILWYWKKLTRSI